MRLIVLLMLAPPLFAEDRLETVFRVYDTDGDGILTRDEIPDEGIFTKADRDGDGKVTREEIGAYLGITAKAGDGKGSGDAAPPDKKPPEKKTEEGMIKEPRTIKERVEDFFRRFDADKDRKVTKTEFQAGEEVYEKYDKSRDDALNEREVTRYMRDVVRDAKRRPTPENFFDLWDGDRDNRVTRKEYDGPGEFFRRYDHDKNDVVTLEELNMGADAGRMQKGDAEFMADGPTEAPRMGLLDRYDADKDGRVTLEELKGNESVLSRLDRNGDGVLSGSEAR